MGSGSSPGHAFTGVIAQLVRATERFSTDRRRRRGWKNHESLRGECRELPELEEKAMSETTYNVIAPETGVPVKAWTKGVSLDDGARKQLLNAAQLPFIF